LVGEVDALVPPAVGSSWVAAISSSPLAAM
jgi:hypothetical protein